MFYLAVRGGRAGARGYGTLGGVAQEEEPSLLLPNVDTLLVLLMLARTLRPTSTSTSARRRRALHHTYTNHTQTNTY